VLSVRFTSCALAIAIGACQPAREDSTVHEREARRVAHLAANRSVPLCTFPSVGDTTNWRRVPHPGAPLTFLLPASFTLADSQRQFVHGGTTWRDGVREFVEAGVHHGEPASHSCRAQLPGVPIAFITTSQPGEPAFVRAWLVGISGVVDTDLGGQSPDPADRELFLRVIATARFDSSVLRTPRASRPAQHN
jgi:hypothetical protein